MSSIYQVLLTIFLNGFTMITAHLEYISDKDELLIFNCLKSSKNHKKHFNKYLMKRFANTYEFCDGDKKFYLMSRRGVYAHEYMDSWKRFDETSLPGKHYR